MHRIASHRIAPHGTASRRSSQTQIWHAGEALEVEVVGAPPPSPPRRRRSQRRLSTASPPPSPVARCLIQYSLAPQFILHHHNYPLLPLTLPALDPP
uniref:Uncharacterized protein n=1 Tax=Physcomitrium patens TaxID=3218 RepID=A0A2K1J9S0_PHYPA|nr:hypothetical protein PHYPA_021370 [Physcomitrium patens]